MAPLIEKNIEKEAVPKIDFNYFGRFLDYLKLQKELVLYQNLLHSIKLVHFDYPKCAYLSEPNTKKIPKSEFREWLQRWEGLSWEVTEQSQKDIDSSDLTTYANYLSAQNEKRHRYIQNHPTVKKMMNVFAGLELDDIVTNIN